MNIRALAAGVCGGLLFAAPAFAYTPYTILANPTGNEVIQTNPPNSSPIDIWSGQIFGGHIPAQTGVTAPSTSAGCSLGGAGMDGAGTLTMTNATGCTLTFANGPAAGGAYNSAPSCIAVWQASAPGNAHYTISASALTLIQVASSTATVNYLCVAPVGG